MGWEFGFPAGGPTLVTAIGPDADHFSLSEQVLAWVLLDGRVDANTNPAAVVADGRQKGHVSLALEGVLAAADTAVTALVEEGYYDLDCRSEDAVAIKRQYRFSPITNRRLHFFSAAVSRDLFVEALTGTEDATKPLRDAYLGYSVLRTNNLGGVVGRTMIAPPRCHSDLIKPDEFHLRVRTRVTEHLTLLGVKLCVEATPFMQQEGGITRCAHVGAWMAHYVAVLRGLVPRVPVADLFPSEASTSSGSLFQRQYPSPGLTESQLVDALVAAGLPPEVNAVTNLAVTDREAWYHRRELHGEAAAWHREAFTTTICRYLNSGLPVLLAKDDHVEVICGYLRPSHLKPGTLPLQPAGGIAAFIACDDGRGPYLIRPVDELLLSVDTLLITPLPRGLTLAGADAEYLGAQFLEVGLENVRVAAKRGRDGRLQRLVNAMAAKLGDRCYAIRCYAVESNTFKNSFAERCTRDPSAVTVVMAARLPKYVWVIEVVDRDRRPSEDEPEAEDPVAASVVIDATAVRTDQVDVLILRVPGAISVRDELGRYTKLFACKARPYRSGRWAHSDPLHSALDPRLSKTCGV